MPIVFSKHAKLQLRRRKISQKVVIEVVKNSKIIAVSFRGRKLRRLSIGAKILQVITITEGSKITVVSGYYLRKKKI